MFFTEQFIGEGFGGARLDTLFLTMPTSWKEMLVQYAGRLHRNHHGKTDLRIFDYVDEKVPMLAVLFEKRVRGYATMGYPRREFEAISPSDVRVATWSSAIGKRSDPRIPIRSEPARWVRGAEFHSASTSWSPGCD